MSITTFRLAYVLIQIVQMEIGESCGVQPWNVSLSSYLLRRPLSVSEKQFMFAALLFECGSCMGELKDLHLF